jgi:WD40 repeat protein
MPNCPENIRAICRATGPGTVSLLIAGVALISLHDGTLEHRVMAASTPSFTKDVVPILQKNCLACHSKVSHKSGLIVDSYESLMKGGKHGQVIAPHDANGSRIVAMLEGSLDPRMPLDDDPLRSSDIAIIRSWIDAGAAGPASEDTTRPLTTSSTPVIRPEVRVVSPVSSVRFSPQGSLLAVGGYREVRIIDPGSGKILATLSGHADYVRSIAFSPDGTMIASAGGAPQIAGEIKIWDVQSHHLLRTMQGHTDCIYSVAWSPDGKLIASGSYDRAVKLWDASTGKEVHTLQDHIDAVFAVAFSPDGRRLASASQDRTVKIWDVVSGRRLFTLSDAADGLTGIAYSPSGDQVAAVGYDKTIYVWRLVEDDGHLSQSLIADQESLLALVWSSNGKVIVTASSDGSIRFRDNKLDLIGVIDRQPDWVEAIAISPNGKWLAAGRYNGTLSLYDTSTYKEARESMVVFDAPAQASGDKGNQAARR